MWIEILEEDYKNIYEVKFIKKTASYERNCSMKIHALDIDDAIKEIRIYGNQEQAYCEILEIKKL